MFEGFIEERVEVGPATILVRHHPGGTPVLLLHGHPRTSATWHRVAPLLVAAGLGVVCADLRGYGRSVGPPPTPDHSAHAKRAVAEDMVRVMDHLGHERFSLVGHDRGSYVALRLALDHPHCLDRLVLIDCIPIIEHLDRADRRFAAAWWHWWFFAQPDLPEQAIGADPHRWYRTDPAAMGEANHAELWAALDDPAVVRAMLEDYRAGLTVDADHERTDRHAGRQVEAPLLVLWSLRDDLEELHGDPLAIWEPWARSVEGHGIDSGHHVAEEAPEELSTAITTFLAR